VSTRIAKSLSYSSYFEQTIEEESRRLATGKQRQKQKQKPRINTEFHGRKAETTEGRKSRSERLATDEHGISRKRHGKDTHTSLRAGCISDGINIRFGKGPFGKLRDRKILAVCLHLP
jgi:hypothetical protein